MSVYDKEKAKVSYFELAPSLQKLINKKGSNKDLMAVMRLFNLIYGNNGDMRITCGVQLPAENPEENNGVNLDVVNMSLQGYGDFWFYHRLVYSD